MAFGNPVTACHKKVKILASREKELSDEIRHRDQIIERLKSQLEEAQIT